MNLPPAPFADPYRTRAGFYAAETARVPAPRPLHGLLAAGPHIGEVPCGAGHFLTVYQRAGCTVTLADASAAMLAVAASRARAAGIPPDRTTTIQAWLPGGPLPTELDLFVSPNAALCQLSPHNGLDTLADAYAGMLRPGGRACFQLACRHRDGAIDAATFYDPDRPHDTWFVDHQFIALDGEVTRFRRQHRDGDLLRIEFDYHTPPPLRLPSTVVELALHTPDQVADALASAGFDNIACLPGGDRLTDITATRIGGPR